MKKNKLCILLLLWSSVFFGESFSQRWREMQHEYSRLMQAFPNDKALDAKYMHAHWRNQRRMMAQILRGGEDHNFLKKGPIAGSMVRNEFSKTQEYELVFLKHCLSSYTQALVKQFQDTSFGGVNLACRDFNCSINALGQLFFFAKLLECNRNIEINTIVEFGGGYGCLARIVRMLLPEVTYIIFDLPEYIAIQSLYLRATLTDVPIIVHTSLPDQYETGSINLVPIFLLPDFDIKADVFVSFAALSETPEFVQNMVIQKHFFNAYCSYLTGPLHGWGAQYNFYHHKVIMDGMRSHYELCVTQPFHHFGGNLLSYDIYGIKLNQK